MNKENLHFDNQIYKLFSFFLSRCVIKEIENIYSVFLSSCRDTRENLGELEKAVDTRACGSCSHRHFSFSQTSTRVSTEQLDYELEISIAP